MLYCLAVPLTQSTPVILNGGIFYNVFSIIFCANNPILYGYEESLCFRRSTIALSPLYPRHRFLSLWDTFRVGPSSSTALSAPHHTAFS